MPATPYVGRFAPSPTGPLHEGSLVAALASWLDAKAHAGHWLVRMEDVDQPRCVPSADRIILGQLADCSLHPDGAVMYQSRRGERYQQALDELVAAGQAFGCACTRADIAAAQASRGQTRARHAELVYPGTCRPNGVGMEARGGGGGGRSMGNEGQGRLGDPRGRPVRAWRLRVPDEPDALLTWQDRRLGTQAQNLATAVGDVVLHRADGLWAYQLAVVVDDADQGVTDVVRGEDLADNTPRQIWLQRCMGLEQPRYLHTPLVLGQDGDKLSKQNGAQAVDTTDPLRALSRAGSVLGLPPIEASQASVWLAEAVARWPWRQLLSSASQ